MRNDVKSLLQKINQAGIPYRVFESDAAPDEDAGAPVASNDVAAQPPAKADAAIPPAPPPEVARSAVAAPAPDVPAANTAAPQFKGLFRHYSAGGEPMRPASASPRLTDIFAEMQRLKGG